jgi:4-hydroxy-tetrahydrodipicolinate synthase
LVPGVKAVIAHIHGDPAWARVEPPLTAFPAGEQAAVGAAYDELRSVAAKPAKTATAGR